MAADVAAVAAAAAGTLRCRGGVSGMRGGVSGTWEGTAARGGGGAVCCRGADTAAWEEGREFWAEERDAWEAWRLLFSAFQSSKATGSVFTSLCVALRPSRSRNARAQVTRVGADMAGRVWFTRWYGGVLCLPLRVSSVCDGSCFSGATSCQ